MSDVMGRGEPGRPVAVGRLSKLGRLTNYNRPSLPLSRFLYGYKATDTDTGALGGSPSHHALELVHQVQVTRTFTCLYRLHLVYVQYQLGEESDLFHYGLCSNGCAGKSDWLPLSRYH